MVAVVKFYTTYQVVCFNKLLNRKLDLKKYYRFWLFLSENLENKNEKISSSSISSLYMHR